MPDGIDDVAEALMQAFNRFKKKEVEADSSKDIRRSEAHALVLLSEHVEHGLKVSELSRVMRVSSPFVTQLINQLEERGLVARRADPKDGRIVNIALTEQGLHEAGEIHRMFHRRFTALVQHLGEAEARTLARLLNKTFDYVEEKKKERCDQHQKQPNITVNDREGDRSS
jgi:DNA-binding MarR family transcriptional regulator